MDYIKNCFKDRTIWFWVSLGSAAAMLIASVLFAAIVGSNDIFAVSTLVFALVGSLTGIALAFIPDGKISKIAMLAPPLFYGLALGKQFSQTMYPLSKYFSPVDFFTSYSLPMGIAFSVIFLAGLAAAITVCFFDMKKAASN